MPKVTIDSFQGDFEFLSNFYPSPIVGKDDEILYPTVEHYFQAHKTLNLEERQRIANASSPGLAKRAGRAVNLRKDWEKVKVNIMSEALELKFEDEELKQKLIATGDAKLVEGNRWHDNYWGNCSCPKCKNIVGMNKLGVLLKVIRTKKQKEG